MTLNRRICGAKTRAGHPCGHAAILGGTCCRIHGGSIGRVKRAAALRVAQEKAVKAISRDGIVPLGDPVEMLRSLASEAVALKDYFSERLKALEELRYQGNTGEQLRSEVALYERALDRSQKFLHDLARLGLDERQVRVSEAQTAIFAGVIARALSAAGLPEETAVLVRSSIANELRLVEAG